MSSNNRKRTREKENCRPAQGSTGRRGRGKGEMTAHAIEQRDASSNSQRDDTHRRIVVKEKFSAKASYSGELNEKRSSAAAAAGKGLKGGNRGTAHGKRADGLGVQAGVRRHGLHEVSWRQYI